MSYGTDIPDNISVKPFDAANLYFQRLSIGATNLTALPAALSGRT